MDANALLCNICPKRPRFSDVSHLLTHVSSKAHLSHYFKLQVRSHQEVEARDLLDDYDRWYKANGLAKLLSDRMASKEARKRKAHGRTLAHATSLTTRRETESQATSTTTRSSSYNLLPDFLDPRLSDPFVNGNTVVGSGDISLSADYNTPTAYSELGTQSHVRTEYTLHSTVPSGDSLSTIQCKQEPDLDSEGDSVSIFPDTPSWSRKLGGRTAMTSQPSSASSICDPFVDGNGGFDYLRLVGGDKERADEMTRLKGVLWPGMDIFDSATEEMRRKRNQKKDESILKMMEKTSMCVEPTELVFSPTGTLRKQRVISGNVEDSSPLKGETPIPKRRITRPKRALSQVDSNVARGQDRKRSKRSKFAATLRGDGPSKRRSQTPDIRVDGLPYGYGGGLYTSFRDEDDEFALSLKGLEPTSRNRFTVFHDESSQHKSIFDNHFLAQEPRLGISSPSRQSAPRRGATSGREVKRSSSNNSASLLPGKVAHMPAEKENIEPMLDTHSRLEPLLRWHSPTMESQHASDAGYPSQYLFDDTQRSGRSPLKGHDMYAGYSFNPLAVAAPKFPSENPIFNADGHHAFNIHSLTRSPSPEATISDIEEDDFERLYLDTSSF